MRPTSVEPVKESLRTRGSCSIAQTTCPDVVVVTTLTTPAGTPASLQERPPSRRRSAAFRVAGFSTQVQPAASAGAILRVAIAAGKFHGVTRTRHADRLVMDEDPVGAARGDAEARR